MRLLLVTGARGWKNRQVIEDALAPYRETKATLVHGDAKGAGQIAAQIWRDWGNSVLAMPASGFSSPRGRNQVMALMGADVCLAFAMEWDSGTGMCARMARRAGVEVIDLGVSTE